MKTPIGALLLMLSFHCTAQDSLLNKINFGLDLGFGVYYQFSSFGNTNFNEAKIPDLLPRRVNEPQVRNNWNLANDLVTDNPFFHGSYFFRVGGQFVYDSTLHLSVAANMEQRGFSDGRFSTNTINIFPYFNARYQKHKGQFSYMLQVGDFWDMKLYEGLTFYNLQTQGWVFKLKYGPFYLKQAGIGDLLRNIGLGIDDLYDYSFGLEKLALSPEQIDLDVRIGYSNNRGSLFGGFWNYALRLNVKETIEFYGQYSSQRAGGAFVVGVDLLERKSAGLRYKASVDVRTYSSGFNLGFTNTVYYRDPNGSSSFTNSTSNIFFPLEFYERPFGQWALFTEYQGRNVGGLNIKGELSQKLPFNIFLKTKLDLNWISTNAESTFYPFYSIGLGYQSEEDIEIMLELTNRVLNLDKNYPTLYASRRPYFMIRAYKPLSFLRHNDQQHRV